MTIDRRTLIMAGLASALSAPASRAAGAGLPGRRPTGENPDFDPKLIYAGMIDGGVDIPAVSYTKLKPELWRRRVAQKSDAPAGTILVNTREHWLYFVNGDGTAIRYGIGVGRDGYLWKGQGGVGRIAAWPRWTPTREMLDRLPELKQFQGGLEGGIANPLGARALYIHKDGRDTLYRIHGSPEWWSVGRSMSSGCIRMLNQDVIDLARRASVGARVMVS